MGKILSRIKVLADNEGITIGALERSIRASKGVLSRAITNNTDIQSKWLEIIAENYPHYSAQWLLTGEGEMLRKEGCEKETTGDNDRKSDTSVFLDRIAMQAEEIGRLKARIAELERRGN